MKSIVLIDSEEKRKFTVAFSKLSSKIEFMFKYKDSTDEEIKNHLIEHCSIDNLYEMCKEMTLIYTSKDFTRGFINLD